MVLEYEVDTNTELYDKIVRYLIKFYNGDKYYVNDNIELTSEEEREWMNSKIRDDKDIYNLEFPPDGIWHNCKVKFDEEDDYRDIGVRVVEVGNPLFMGTGSGIHMKLFIRVDNRVVWEKMMYIIKHDKEDDKMISIFVRNQSCKYWTILSRLPKRNIDTVFLPFFDDLIADLDDFSKKEEDYIGGAIPYKRNYLLHGPPGCGKTSVITAVASHFNSSVSIMNFGIDLDDVKFMGLVTKLRDHMILVLEDIDALFVGRKSGEKNMVSFSAVLNVLDGLCRKHRLITFMTTNHKDKLDPALLRVGRIDKIYEFGYASKEQVGNMYDFYRKVNKSEDEKKDLIKYLRGKEFSTAVIQKFLFENRDVEDLRCYFESIDVLIDQYKEFKGSSVATMYT